MDAPRVAVAFVPREVFSTTERSLETLRRRTRCPHELIVVDGNSPPATAAYLDRAAAQQGFTLLRSDDYLTPNQARNLAARQALLNPAIEYVVFVDNDVQAHPGWLDALVRCADETDAWLVGPTYYEHLPERRTLHMFGGTCQIETDEYGRRTYREHHHLAHTDASELEEPLVRQKTELIEFHTVLARRKVFDTLGMLDEGLMCHSEHGDLSLGVRAAGGAIWLEPAAEITYVPPRRLAPDDREFFHLRWSEAWLEASQRRLQEKYNLDQREHDGGRGRSWVGYHRRYGSETLRHLRRLIGRKLTRSLEKRVYAPLESRLNRWQYPREVYGELAKAEVRIVQRGQKHEAA